MTGSRRRTAATVGITSISVEGYKSLRTRHDIGIRPLTVLAGVNSSGKSSAIQPLLLLKQTLDTPYDPGPLHLSGPNVDVTAVEQVLSKGDGTTDQARYFKVGVTAGDASAGWVFGREDPGGLRILETTLRENARSLSLRLKEGMPSAEIWRQLPASVSKNYLVERDELSIRRERSSLIIGFRDKDQWYPVIRTSKIELELARVIHLPALRGNPRRTYNTVAVEDRFPGTFDVYTAGVITAWQNRNQKDELNQLRKDLQELGLTWNVEARLLNDTQVELMVGRLHRTQGGGARDLVNIADVGFGVSQTLPVIVALLVANPGQLVYLEQPEIHLHPRAQVMFANLLRRAVDRGVRVVVETHSALLIRAVQTLVAQQQLTTASVILHWFTRDPRTGDTEISTAELDQAGAFGDWPEDFDEVYLESEARYLDAAAEASQA